MQAAYSFSCDFGILHEQRYSLERDTQSMEKVNHEQRAALAWDVLIQHAGTEKTISYSDLADRIGIHWRPIRFVLEYIQQYCIAHDLPPLTILAVSKTGKLGKGFTAVESTRFEEERDSVYRFEWSKVENPFEYARNGETVSSLAKRVLANPDEAWMTIGAIKARGIAQRVFRSALLKAYKGKCAFCELSWTSALQAAHIVPWSEAIASQKIDVRNGLLLCATHHALFDQKILTVSDDYRIQYNAKSRGRAKLTQTDQLIVADLDKKSIRLPKLEVQRPDKTWLESHRNGMS